MRMNDLNWGAHAKQRRFKTMPNNQRLAASKPPSPPPAIGHVSADGMATVLIGPSKIKYLVHKALLVHHSEYFAKALNGPWTEAEERVVTPAGVGEEEFNLFVHWLYTQQIPTEFMALRSVVKRPDAPQDQMNMSLVLVKTYALGNRILASKFRRQVNNVFIGCKMDFGMSIRLLPTITYAFANIPNDRNILQFLTNGFCKDYNPELDEDGDEDAMSEFPPAFTVRVIKCLAYLRYDGLYDGCYVEHATDEEQRSCKKRHLKFSGGENGYGHFSEPKQVGLLG